MVVEVGDPGVPTQKFLRAFSSFEPLLTPLLSPYGSVFLFNNVVAPSCRNHLPTVDISQPRDIPECGTLALQLIGVNNLWDGKLTQEVGQEGLRRFCIPISLKENVEHEPVLVDRPP